MHRAFSEVVCAVVAGVVAVEKASCAATTDSLTGSIKAGSAWSITTEKTVSVLSGWVVAICKEVSGRCVVIWSSTHAVEERV